ncbi:MAG: hypothetical protein ACYCOY_06460 [Metallibacterium sp.]
MQRNLPAGPLRWIYPDLAAIERNRERAPNSAPVWIVAEYLDGAAADAPPVQRYTAHTVSLADASTVYTQHPAERATLPQALWQTRSAVTLDADPVTTATPTA